MRIGERLLQLRLIKKADLADALTSQALRGGRLGTHLVQQGSIELDTLSTALGAHLGVAAALPSQFEQAPQNVLSRLPVELAERYLAVPLMARPSGTLVVAMVDPKALGAIDAIEKAIGSRIQVCVAPELRMRYWLEKHYGIKRENMYLRVGEPLASEDPTPVPERRRYVASSPAAGEPLGRIALRRAPTGPSANGPAPVAVREAKRERAGSPDLQVPIDEGTATRSAGAERAIKAIAAAQDGDAIAIAVCEYLTAAAGGGLLLSVRLDMALGWRAAAPLDPHVASLIAVPLVLPTAFRLAWETRSVYRGAVPASGRGWHERLAGMLGQPPPRDALVVPVLAAEGGKVLALVYAQSVGSGELPEALVADLEAIAEAIAAAVARRANLLP